ncbi:hypothetical protein FS749_009687 [Ceratobasidium sp. UAMH 11750]|nr:hypothetical protein FS749_009687 [Ceratobasidium sp. UAMH 11750]
MNARAARIAAMKLPTLPRPKGREGFPTRFTCPYCGFQLKRQSSLDRHIELKLFCRKRHLDKLEGERERKRKRSSRSNSPLPESKCTRMDEVDPPVAGPSRLPGPYPTVLTPNDTDGNADGMENGVFVEKFPIKMAGAPIGTRSRQKADLKQYLETCGALSDRDLLETAEIMMTTGLTGRGRNKHLKGPLVSN